MLRPRFYVMMVMLCLAALLMGACASQPSPTPDLEVSDATDARDAALVYLREHEGQNAPNATIEWQEEDVTPPDWEGAVFTEFTSDEWTVTVVCPVVPPESAVYQVVVSSVKLGWHWKGSVKADGSVTEVSAFKQMSEEESKKIAEQFVRNSPTFAFDGIENTLELTGTLTVRCPYCWVFIFEFDSRHPGYGDRTGEVLAEVITPHRAAIAVEQLEITSALMDDRWDMLRRQMLDEQGNPLKTLMQEMQKAIEIATNDPLVKEETSGEGYEVGKVRQWEPEEPGDFVVDIHVGKRDLPGIYLSVLVDLEQEKVLSVNRHLRPRQLTEEEKAEAQRIALSDPQVLERIGDKEYEVSSIEEASWSRGDEFFVFPAVGLNIPPDMQVEGLRLRVFVDLEAKKVVEIHSAYRKPLPPTR